MIRPLNRASRRYASSSSFQIALLFTLLLGLATGGLGWLVYSYNRANLVRESEAAIDIEIASLSEWYDSEGMPALRRIMHAREAHDARSFNLLLSAKGEKLAGNLPHLPQAVTPLSEGLIQFEWPVPGGSPLTLAAKIHTFPDGEILLVGRDIGALIVAHQRIVWLTVAMIALMAAVVVVSFLISAFVVRRINLIAATAGRIIATDDLSQRIPLAAGWDDLSHLAHILNSLFARIERLMGSLRDVSENVAHDLRTPLTRLRNRLEELERSSPAIEGLVAEADQLLATFASLLRIAQLESGRALRVETVDLSALLRDVGELYEPLAEAGGIMFSADLEPATIQADRDLLFQLFANLLDNAVKFTPKGGAVRLASRTFADHTIVKVTDSGIGIPREEQHKVFERFYRRDPSRHLPGNGLGLSLVAAIALAHRFPIALRDTQPGLEVEIRFPIELLAPPSFDVGAIKPFVTT